MTDKLDDAVTTRLREVAERDVIDAVNKETVLPERVNGLWKRLNAPIVRDRFTIDLNPERLIVGSFNGRGEILETVIGVRAKPVIALDGVLLPRPMPPLPPADIGPHDDTPTLMCR